MDLIYIFFSFALAVFNLYRGLNWLNMMNFIFQSCGWELALSLR